MYAPRGFDGDLAIELGELIVQAYDQFAAFEDKRPWSLPAKYRLVCELNYTFKPAKANESKAGSLEIDFRKFFNLKDKSYPTMPIGFIAERGKMAFVIFRGTKTTKEWISNLGINLKEYPLPNFGNAHEGFLQMYDSTRSTIAENLPALARNHRVLIAGHSLGAALATLALPDIETNMKIKASALYTYGSPRVGDDAFVKAFDRDYSRKSYRVTNTSDLVTSIPFPIPLAGFVGGYFSHVDTPVDFTTQNNDLEKNHAMETYISALSQAHLRRGFFQRLFERNAD
jgi:triacylglycerol lipase